MRETNKLSVAEVSSLSKVGRYSDGGGLYLQVAAGGSKQWVFRFMMDRVPRTAGLGSTATFSLAEARKRARKFRQLVRKRHRPYRETGARARSSPRGATDHTFRRKPLIASSGPSDPSGRTPCTQTSGRVRLKRLFSRRSAIVAWTRSRRKMCLDVLEPIWLTRSETARRVRARIENILDWAAAARLRSGENPAAWKTLQHLLPKKNKNDVQEHHAALPYGKLPDVMAELRERDGVDTRALEFTVLTAARSGETLGALWSEIDLEKSLWTIPPTRMKGGKTHRVPLSERAVAILKSLPVEHGNPFVFVGRAGKGLGKMALARALETASGKGATVHGMRSSFRDWCAEQTAFAPDICEAALAHSLGDATREAYERSDKLERRRALMAAWASFCEGAPVENVLPMRRSN